MMLGTGRDMTAYLNPPMLQSIYCNI